MKKYYLTILLAVLITLAITGKARADERVPSQDDILWARGYIQDRVQDATFKTNRKVKIYPSEFSLTMERGAVYAVSFCQVDPLQKAVTPPTSYDIVLPTPQDCGMMFSNFADFSEVFWKGILIHEVCHLMDHEEIGGCGCDPYTIQYAYYIEMEQRSLISDKFSWKKHNMFRECRFRKDYVKRLNESK